MTVSNTGYELRHHVCGGVLHEVILLAQSYRAYFINNIVLLDEQSWCSSGNV